MEQIINLLNYTFIQRALICGISISICAALMGVILVLKNYSMIGHGLGEVGFASLTLAVALNLPPLAVSLPIVLISAKRRKWRYSNCLRINRSTSNWNNYYISINWI